jgi:hypothetical protein
MFGVLLPLLVGLAQAQPSAPERHVGFGFALELGSQRIAEGVRVPAADLRTVETRYFLTPETSVDLRVDWVRLLLTRLLTSNPELPLSACVHFRWPRKRRWSWALAPGLDTSWGVESLVIDERLAYRPTAMLAYVGKLGLEHSSRDHRFDWGLYLRHSLGADLAVSGSEPVNRFVLEISTTWNTTRLP